MALRKEQIERFEGMEDLQLRRIFEDKVETIMIDFANEGFDKEDIIKYLQHRIQEIADQNSK